MVNLKPSLVWSRSQSLLRSRCFNGTVKKDLWDLISSYLFSIVQNASLPSTLRNWFIASVLFFLIFMALRHYLMSGITMKTMIPWLNHFHENWNIRLVKTFPCVAAYMSSLAIIAIAIDRFVCYLNFPHFALLFIHSTCKYCLFFIHPLVKNWQNKLAIFVSLLHLWHIPSFLLSLINFPSYQKLFSQYFFFAKRKILFPIRYCEQANITIIPRLTDCWNIVDINENFKTQPNIKNPDIVESKKLQLQNQNKNSESKAHPNGYLLVQKHYFERPFISIWTLYDAKPQF